MGTTLTGTTPQDTYDSLIKVTDNGPLSGTAKYLSDGLGNDSVLALSTTAVGIGITAPVGLLDLYKAAAATRLAIRGDAGQNRLISYRTGALQRFGLYVNNTAESGANAGSDFAIRAYSDAGTLLSTPFFINRATGNVGIGTSNPVDGKLCVTGATAAGNSIVQTYLTVAAASTRVTADGRYAIGLDGAAGATERVSVTVNGLTFNGDTAAANALDDYEEGTWTMGLAFGGASVGVTYVVNTGTYTKIGRQVTVNGFITLSNKGSSVGDARVTGLPFTIPNNTANYSTASVKLLNVSFTNQFVAYGVINSTNIDLEEVTILGAGSTLTNADFANNSSVMVSLTYFV